MPFSTRIHPRRSGFSQRRNGVWGRLRSVPGGGAWAVLVLGLLLTWMLTARYAAMQRDSQVRQFEDAVDRMTLSIQNRLHHYNTVLRAAAGMFRGSDEVTPSEFANFIAHLELETLYAGMHRIGYVRVVRGDEVDALHAQLQRYPEYAGVRLHLADEQSEHLVITHLEPKSELYHEAIGYDLAGDTVRRETMQLALERGSSTATPLVTLLPGRGNDGFDGVVVYLPVYKDGGVDGFVYGAVATRSLIDVVLAYYPHLAFEVYEGRDPQNGQSLFERPAVTQWPQSLRTSRTLALAGRPWTIVFRGGSPPDPWLATLPLAGLMLSVLFALFVSRLSSARVKLTERAELLAQQREWLAVTLGSIGDAVVATDSRGRISYMNSRAEQLTGWDVDDVVDRDAAQVINFVDEQTQQPIADPVTAAIEMGKNQPSGAILICREREHVPVEYTGAPIKTDADETIGAVITFRDVRERRESEARFRTMADSAPVYIWMSDTTKGGTWFNKAWLAFTGRTMEQEVGFGWFDGLHPEDRDRCIQVFDECFDARSAFKVKFRLKRADGQYRWLLDHGVPLYEPDGTFAGYIGSCIDITDLEAARQTLERSNSDLERLVDERTEKLRQSNEQLRLSERMAALGTLAAGIGHDLGNLLLPMRIRLDLLEQRLPPEGRDDLQVIRTSAEYLGNLAKGLRYLSTDPRRGDSAGARTELAAWWAEALPMLKNALPKTVMFEYELPAELPALAVSPAALMQAVFNLVQNSGNVLRDRPRGHVRVWADLEKDEQGEPAFVRVGVSDDGPGMDPEVKRRCIEPFYSTRTREFSTGLGLSLVQGVVQRAGGRMEIESESGEGTTIILRFPLAPDPVPVGSERAPAPKAHLLIADMRLKAFVTAELQALGYELADDRSSACLWVLDGDGPAENLSAESRGNLQKLKEDLREFVEEGSNRTIVLLRQPEPWTDIFRDINGRLIRTSGGFKPSEIREALRKAAGQAVAIGPSHGAFDH